MIDAEPIAQLFKLLAINIVGRVQMFGFVASTAASMATGRSDLFARRDSHPLKIRDFSRRTLAASPFHGPDGSQVDPAIHHEPFSFP